MPRISRKKMSGRGCYYHLYNRVAGYKDELPFTDVDKEHGFRLLEELNKFFLIELISVSWMGNHMHIVCFSPGEIPSIEDAAKRHNAFYGAKRIELEPRLNPDRCLEMAEQMIDISHLMRVFQQRFTCYMNRVHNRRGTLWADRFKSTILEGSRESLWNCVKYVELNPVRAGIVDDPADYRFCSWGRFAGSGKHPFQEAFCQHMRAIAQHHAGVELSDDAVFAEFRAEVARLRAWEAGKDAEEIHDAAEKARTQGDSMRVRFMRRTRHWTDGAIIGSKAFVQDVGCLFEDRERLLKKQLSRGDGPDGPMYCFKRLRLTAN